MELRNTNANLLIRIGIFMSLITLVQLQAEHNFTNDDFSERSVVLSRRKRFLIFPEGSSLQLVFCTTFPLLTLGDIVLWGYTAALAYELPQDPYSPFMHHADPLHRRMDSKAIYFTDEEGKVLHKMPYKKKFIVNPAFAKRSVDGAFSSSQFKKETHEKFKIDRKQMHASKNKRQFLKSEHMEASSVEFHRSSRGALYQKIDTMLRGMGTGRDCLLKTLCLIGKTQHHPQGAFLDEILRAVFTIPQGTSTDVYQEYDEAFSTDKSCDDIFPDCSEPPSDLSMPTLNY